MVEAAAPSVGRKEMGAWEMPSPLNDERYIVMHGACSVAARSANHELGHRTETQKEALTTPPKIYQEKVDNQLHHRAKRGM